MTFKNFTINIFIISYGVFLTGGSLTCLGASVYHLIHRNFEWSISAFIIGSIMGIWGYGLIRRLHYSRLISILINIILGIFYIIGIIFPNILNSGEATEYQLGILSAVRFWAAIISFLIIFLFTRMKVKRQFK